MSTYKDMVASTEERAARDLGDHIMLDGLVRSYRFFGTRTSKVIAHAPFDYPFGKVAPLAERATFHRQMAYSYTLTWTPGKMVLTGDIGEMVLTHYHAMPTFEEALEWLRTSDYDYLLGKSDKRREYDSGETLRQLKRRANEEIVQELWGYTTKWWRKDTVTGENVCDTTRHRGLIHDIRDWRKTTVGDDLDFDYATEEDKLADKPKVEFTSKRDALDIFEKWALAGRRGRAPIEEVWDIPDSWRLYVDLWMHYEGDFYWPSDDKDNPEKHPTAVLKPACRRRLWDQLESDLSNGEHNAAETLYQIMDDVDLSYAYTDHAFFQIAAIRSGCEKIRNGLAQMKLAIERQKQRELA